MKKLLIILILSTMFLSGCGSGLYNLNLFTLPDDAEFLALIQELDTPRKICRYMLDNFETEEHPYIALTPYELYLTRKGDCDDFSAFSKFIANYHGYITFQIKMLFASYVYVYPVYVYHVITVFTEYGHYTFAENQYYNPYGGYHNSFGSIMQIYHGWVSYTVYDYYMNIVEQVTK
ncbi:hypothetical protein ES695_11520 [Candidatus Atribacteria bacterium 1244-E10-H5-B2]|nr:MAG: hypothetical protein ES695_11520 [Candidatus Atribacteria bacterium 1244-E10-H5-B2]